MHSHTAPRGRLLWHILAVALLLLFPAILLKSPILSARPAEAFVVMALAAGYALSALLLAIARRGGRELKFVPGLSIPLAVFAAVFFLFLLHHPPDGYSRAVLIAVFAAAMILLYAEVLLRSWRVPLLTALGVAVLAATALNIHQHRQIPLALRFQRQEADIPTGFYTLHEVTYHNAVPKTDVYGGGIAKLGDRFVLATGDGRLFDFGWNDQGQLGPFKALPYHVPLNTQEFIAAVNAPGGLGALGNTEEADRQRGVQIWQFRTADILIQERGERMRLFASHHYWNGPQKCFLVRVSMLETTSADFAAGNSHEPWQTLFETHPCLPLQGENAIHANNPFSGMEIGGRMALRDENTLLLTLGDHNFAGVESKQLLSQDPSASYGTPVLIDLRDKSSSLFTIGHRNPQGLYIDNTGLVWSTEHGPQGGDELNLLSQGKNYGWPLVTYGTDYGAAGWPLSKHQGSHEGYELPVYAWMPSVGTSSLLRVEKDRFPVWKGDLLVGSLHGKTLFRLKLEGTRVAYAEPIVLGKRIRDILEDDEGRLLIWTDSADVITLAPASGTGGAYLFAKYCAGCHKAVDGHTHTFGPDLYGIVNRKAATASGYDSYSPALKAFGKPWDGKQLDRFLENPQITVPGTAMSFQGVKNAEERAAVIKYLAGLK